MSKTNRTSKRIEQPLTVWAASLAALFARQCNLPIGRSCYWEAPIARHLAREVESGKSRDEVRLLYIFQLGLMAAKGTV